MTAGQQVLRSPPTDRMRVCQPMLLRGIGAPRDERAVSPDAPLELVVAVLRERATP